MNGQNLIPASAVTDQLAPIVLAWAKTKTDLDSMQASQLLHDKQRDVLAFFAHAGKMPAQCGPADVAAWIDAMERKGLSRATVYARASRVSSFYNWTIKHAGAGVNPVDPVRPKPVIAYQSDKTKALSDAQMGRLLRHVATLAETTKNPRRRLTYLRDHALLLALFTSGLRRNEILQLTWGTVRLLPHGIEFDTRVKGGTIRKKEIAQPAVKDALLHYLRESDRLDTMQEDSPLWMGHDARGIASPSGIDARCLAYNVKRYGKAVGIPDLHIHMTRHTFARIVAEDTGSLVAAQDALDHTNAGTTKTYVQRLGVKRDKHSDKIMGRIQG
jgi:site-specific recombinase XerD